MPGSIKGSGTPSTPSAPPTAITIGKTMGRIQIAGRPRKAPQMPTATMAATWSQPKSGWVKPETKPPWKPSASLWAATGRARQARQTASRPAPRARVSGLIPGMSGSRYGLTLRAYRL